MCDGTQVQFSLLDRRPLGPNGMLQLCKERDLKLLCYGVVGGGLLTDRHLRSPQRLVYSALLYGPMSAHQSFTCRTVQDIHAPYMIRTRCMHA